jgi:hypothetical protein
MESQGGRKEKGDTLMRMMLKREVMLTEKHNQMAKDGDFRKTLSREGKSQSVKLMY